MPRSNSCVWAGPCPGATAELCADCIYITQESLEKYHEEETARDEQEEEDR